MPEFGTPALKGVERVKYTALGEWVTSRLWGQLVQRLWGVRACLKNSGEISVAGLEWVMWSGRRKRAQRGTQNPLIRLYRMPSDLGFYSARDGKSLVCTEHRECLLLIQHVDYKVRDVNQSWDQSAAASCPPWGLNICPKFMLWESDIWCQLLAVPPLNFSLWTIRSESLKQGWCSTEAHDNGVLEISMGIGEPTEEFNWRQTQALKEALYEV